MAHFAKLDENNKVLEVHFVANDDLENKDYPESEALGITKLTNDTGYSNWKQTSFNSNFRGHFAQEGYTYDNASDTFITIKPFSLSMAGSPEHKWAYLLMVY